MSFVRRGAMQTTHAAAASFVVAVVVLALWSRRRRHCASQTCTPSLRYGYERDGVVLPGSLPRAMPLDVARSLGAKVIALQASTGKAPGGLLQHGHTRYRWMYDIVTNPIILNAVEHCLRSSDILCWSCSVFAKPPRSAGYVGWHQDIAYWGLQPADSVVTAWVALTDVGDASGPMELYRGSHREPSPSQVDTRSPDNMLSRGQEIAWTAPIDPQRVARATMAAGCFSLHHASLAHASGPNGSDGWRIGVAIRYMPCSAWSERAEETAMLVRGRDRYGHFTLERPPADDPDDPSTMAQFVHGRAVKNANTL